MIWLVGMMGSGKTTVGRRLAQELDLPFWDSDTEVEASTGLTVRRLWESKGEAALRVAESAVVQELAVLEEGVVATGGGVVLDPTNVEAMRDSGQVIWLSASASVLASRISGTDRPLLDVDDIEGRLREILDQRRHRYESAAHVVIDTEASGLADIVAAVAGAVA